MSNTAIAADLHEPLNVQVDLAPKVTLDGVLTVDDLANTVDFFLAELPYPGIGIHIGAVQDTSTDRRTNPIDVGQRDENFLVSRDVYAGDASQALLLLNRRPEALALLLLVFGIAANDEYYPVATDNLASFAAWLD
jgi:hypothetical protein